VDNEGINRHGINSGVKFMDFLYWKAAQDPNGDWLTYAMYVDNVATMLSLDYAEYMKNNNLDMVKNEKG